MVSSFPSSYFSSFFSGWVKGFSDVYNERKTDGCTFSIVKQPDPRAFSPATSFLRTENEIIPSDEAFSNRKRFDRRYYSTVIGSELRKLRRFTLLRFLMD